jgi:hypothetical protein
MRKRERAVLEQIDRLNGGLHWSKVESLLRKLGAEVMQGRGSAINVELNGVMFHAHLPHPRPECGVGLVKRLRLFLRKTGHL